MNVDSDSDSDLEFLAEVQQTAKKPSNRGARPPAAADLEATRFKQEYFEKLGENEILRSQLNTSALEHQRNITEILAQQSRLKEEYQKQIEQVKRALERERVQHQFLLAELRLKNSGHEPVKSKIVPDRPDTPTSQTITPTPTSSTATTTSASRTRTAAHAAFSDGFVMKRPKTSASFAATAKPSTTVVNPSVPPASQPSKFNQSDSSRLMTFLINHRAPGFDSMSLQLLFECENGKESFSIGQDLSQSLSFGEFAVKLVEYVEEYRDQLDKEVSELLLSVLYDSLFLGLAFASHEQMVSTRIIALALQWLKEIKPLPTFEKLEAGILVRISEVRLLTCLLYSLDVLLAANWEFELPHELCRRLLVFPHIPQLYARGIDLMAAHPQSSFVPLLTLQFPMIPVDPPHVELLFSGMADCHKLAAVEVTRQSRPPSKFCKFVTEYSKLEEYEKRVPKLSEEAFEYMQVASIKLAESLMRSTSTSADIDQHVLGLLSGSVDAYPLNPESPVVEHAIFYLWCRDYTSLRQNLESGGMAELCVCLTKAVYDFTENNVNSTVEQARQLLQILTSSEEVDRLYEAFETPELDVDDDDDNGDASDDLMLDRDP